MKVHKVLQGLMLPALPCYDVVAILQSINHKVSAALNGSEGHRGERTGSTEAEQP